MGYLFRALVATVVLAIPWWSHLDAPVAHAQALVSLSQLDRLIGSRAAQLAGHSPASAMRWLTSQHAVQTVQLGRDHATLELHFTDGRAVVILPAAPVRASISPAVLSRFQPQVVGHDTPVRRAIVLEPFATELDLGVTAGQDEANAFKQAGFSVDIYRNAQVTVPLMESLAQYSAIYFQTHAGLLPNGDAVVVTGETNDKPYQSLYDDHSLIQAFVAGDPKKTLYNSFTSTLVNNHMGLFPNNSFIFLNGCAALSAYTLVSAFHAHNLSTVIGWDGELYSPTNGESGTYILARMALGETVSEAISDARIEGIGISIVGTKASYLGYSGDGAVSLRSALGVNPLPTPAPPVLPVVSMQSSGPVFSGWRYGPAREL